MKDRKNKTHDVRIYMDEDLYKDFKGIGNGASPTDTVRALLAIAIKHEEAPFGIYEENKNK